ncbi:MAG: UDP-N-acetylmuramoyl-tripeptide--D-alanyl-D-alanine ligase [Campylobacteraceae bacterium]|nr:UDP-N-acetylmuramoyl-tripeptide--D-alanyl-D-alanine ligase [Campylobacteraceae bacterium]
MEIFIYISSLLFVFALGYYLMSTLQWYSYKIERIIFHFSKPLWHIFFFVIPVFAYYFSGLYFWIYFYFAYLPSLYIWNKKQDKKLVFTPRVKRFFVFLAFSCIFFDLLCMISKYCGILGVLTPILIALGISYLFERMLFLNFSKKAKQKIEQNEQIKIITITASYGKTSIKNFLYHMLKDDFEVYKTPRSVNTLAGLVKDVNVDLPEKTKIYISEAGARQKGDIDEIARFLNPHIAVVGEIGEQHIEYFKTLENIRNTKMELLNSNRLEKYFLHVSTNAKPDEKGELYGEQIKDVKASLDGINFTLNIDGKDEEFFAPILGEFNATNLTVCILVALHVGLPLHTIKDKIATLKSVEHRLQRMDAGGKVIIDDSFNGNFEGMSSSYKLVSSYEGRKVLVTPGIVESTKEENERLAKIIDEIFDVVIITGKLNAQTLASCIKQPEVLMLEQKSKMQEMLAENTRVGDLILFSNDAPEFI